MQLLCYFAAAILVSLTIGQPTSHTLEVKNLDNRYVQGTIKLYLQEWAHGYTSQQYSTITATLWDPTGTTIGYAENQYIAHDGGIYEMTSQLPYVLIISSLNPGLYLHFDYSFEHWNSNGGPCVGGVSTCCYTSDWVASGDYDSYRDMNCYFQG
ncbi:hypothetical protein DL96DRAFT_909721 [Flagelloscypha sp. PMI_526]|nr:hypothetical protein DL96DRAFT_909721 [Flagelloscypha sp. PMI_526]